MCHLTHNNLIIEIIEINDLSIWKRKALLGKPRKLLWKLLGVIILDYTLSTVFFSLMLLLVRK